MPGIQDGQVVTFAEGDTFFTGPFKDGKFSKVREVRYDFGGLQTSDFTPSLDEFEGDPESWDEINEWIRNYKMERGLVYSSRINSEGNVTYRSIR
mmetsp:Transcript_21038/g.32573  ORF Transcript_21038/g.32573 Transcript_21038/m.32573 type:complete len:95 (-) Transcript_21038:60-344(-)